MIRKTTPAKDGVRAFESMIFDPTLAGKYIVFCSEGKIEAPGAG